MYKRQALGGGSAMDQAKAVAAIVTNGKTTVEWGDVELEHSILPLICIPSTAGTGSEAVSYTHLLCHKGSF